MKAFLLNQRFYVFSLAVTGLLIATVTNAEDWTRFRGPNGSGISSETVPLCATWSATENLKWKVKLPGPGSSCPIIVGDKVFVTCWTGYGMSQENPGKQEDLRRQLLCINRASGETIWSKAIDPVLPEDVYNGMFAEHGYASHTPVSDGERVYVYFGKSGAVAFDLTGKQLWQTIIGDELDPRRWGSASSPILFKDVLIVTATAESEAVVGLDKHTGKEIWRKEARGLNSCWGTPVLVEVSPERTDLVIGVPNEIWAFDPEKGTFRWYCEAMETDSFCSSVVAADGVVFAVEGRGGGSIAVRAGGKGDVTKTNVLWTGRDSNRIGTPIAHQGHLYFFGNRVANCIRCEDGSGIYQERLAGGSNASSGGNSSGSDPGRPGGGGRGGRGGGGFGGDYASPVLADGKIIFTSRSGDFYVIKTGPVFESLAVNRLTNDREDFSSTPAISNGELFVRSDKHLYCVGN